MFYSHQILARKTPLGQIWMVATLHRKINRRKLDKLNLIKICDEILNPAIPMALRLSGILMGGVVIVYERKVKLLYDDVTRLVLEINQAWKVKSVPDPTVLPKGKAQAKKEAVTLPEPKDFDAQNFEKIRSFSNAAGASTMEFQQNGYFAVRFDDINEAFYNNDQGEEDISHHQADEENITIFERFSSCQATAAAYNQFERFDIEEDEDTQRNFTSGEQAEIPTTLVPSPPPQNHAQGGADEIEDHHPENPVNQQSDERKVAKQGQLRQGAIKRKTRRQAGAAMDYEQTIIPGHIYQTWLQNASDIVSRRGRKRKSRRDILATTKVANLMEIPPMVLMDELSVRGRGDIYYPTPILELWMKSTQPINDMPSDRTSPPLPPEPSISTPQRAHYESQTEAVFEGFQSRVGSQAMGASIEKLRPNGNINPVTAAVKEIKANHVNNGIRNDEPDFSTPNSAYDLRSLPSSESGHGIPANNVEVTSARSNKKRPCPSSRHSGSSLEPVAEENWSGFSLSRLSEKGHASAPELLEETDPTQTQPPNPLNCQPFDGITDSIRTQLKEHFETPGAPQVESLNKLATGMNRKWAAVLFYLTCVLATCDALKVEQKVPYGEILISKGAKMS